MLTGATVAWPAPVTAQAQRGAIPSAPLDEALEAFARQYGLQLVYRSDLAQEVQSGGANSGLSPAETMQQLLQGTGLEFSFLNDRTIAIFRRATGDDTPSPHSPDQAPGNLPDNDREETTGEANVRHRGMLARFLGAVAALVSGTAPAQETDQSQETVQLEEVVVTAQRREERLQDVPIAISALGPEDLAKASVTDLAGLRGIVPGLTISYSAGINSSNLVSIRGVPGLTSPIGAGQATAVYLDGVYLPRPNAAFFSLDDVERLEVLRGPQGTLYGRNATAGAINIITRNPGDTLRGGFDVSYGNFDAVNARGSLSGPLTGGLSAGISASYDRHDGYFTNTVTGRDIGDRESHTVRGSFRYANSGETFSALLSGDSSKNSRQEAFRAVYAGGVYVGIVDPDQVSLDAPVQSYTKSYGTSLTLNYKASEHLDLISITADRKITASDIYDLDGSAVPPALLARSYNTSKTFSQELRGVFSSDRLNVTAGVNYFNEDAAYRLGDPAAPAPADTSELNAYAAFTQIEYEIVPKITLVGGLRYNKEDRDFVVDYSRSVPAGARTSGNIEDSTFIPSAGANWKLSSDFLLYAKFGRSYQAPGFNGQPGAASGLPNTFDAEYLNAYEAGIKSQLLDRRLTFNAAAFWYDYKDLQVRTVTAPGQTNINNAASATIKGAEVSLTAAVTRNLTLSGQGAYIDTAYGDFCEPISGGAPLNNDPICADPTRADRSGNRLNLAPRWSGSVSASYLVPVGTNQLTFSASYSWESNSYFTAANQSVLGTSGWDRLDSRLSLTLKSGLELYAYGKNLTDVRYVGYALPGTATLTPTVVSDPRTCGAGLRYHF